MNQSIKWIIGVIVVVVIAAIGYFVYKGPIGPVSTEPIKIGLVAPLTGEAASFGEGTLAGANLALKEINESGGINGRRIELVSEDDKCSKEGVNAFNKLINIDKVTAIVGPVCSASGGPGLPVAQKAGVPTIIIAASAPHLTKIGDYIFRNYPSDSVQGEVAADFIFNNLKKTKAAVVYVKNDWGQGLNDVFVGKFKQLGGTVVFSEGVSQESRDIRTVLAKAKSARPEAIFFPTYPGVGVVGLKQMIDLGFNVPIVGGDAFDTKEVTEVPQADGVLFMAGKVNNPDVFKVRVKEVTGKESNLATPLTYDDLKILAKVMKEMGTDRKAIRDGLAKLSYREGVSFPLIEFDQNGDLKKPSVEVKIIKDGKAEPYQPK